MRLNMIVTSLRYLMCIPLLAIVCICNSGNAQITSRLGRPFTGKYDSQYGLPFVKGKLGEKDSTALAEVKEFAAVSIPESWPGVQFDGYITRGSKSTAFQTPARMTLAPYGGFRIDLSESDGTASVRFLHFYGGYRNPAGVLSRFRGSLLGGPFIDAAQLLEVIKRPDVSLIDDGIETVDSRRLHRITLVMPVTPEATASTSAFSVQRSAWDLYFDPLTHYLFKTVRLGGYGNHNANGSVQVITYGDYQKVQGYEVPFMFVQTDNGQAAMSYTASAVNKASDADYSYFRF